MSKQIIDIKGEIMENGPDPRLSSGVRLTNAAANTDGTTTVVAGALYVFTALVTGGFYFGVEGTTQTAANVLWVCPLAQTIYIEIPVGYTSLHYATDTNSGIGYLRRIR